MLLYHIEFGPTSGACMYNNDYVCYLVENKLNDVISGQTNFRFYIIIILLCCMLSIMYTRNVNRYNYCIVA